MAQGFTAISTSLGEAERVKNGKTWTSKDYAEHQQHYNIDPTRTHLNRVYISVNGLNEREVVNHFMLSQMKKINQTQINKVNQWNEKNSEPDPVNPGKRRMLINSKTGKKYGKRSINKTRMYPVGKYAGKGSRQMPYDVFKSYIERGNARGKEADSTRLRTGVLQQFAISFGNTEEWQTDPVRKYLFDDLHSGNAKREAWSKKAFEDYYVTPYLKQFQQENPSLHMVQIVIHYDETNPHIQFTVLPHVDGPQSGGLGSVGYTETLKHDHPELTPSKIVAEFYQSQHEHLREIIKTAKPGLVNQQKQAVSMTLGPRPGTHKSQRVDVFAQMQQNNDRQLKYIANSITTIKSQVAALDQQEKALTKKQTENKVTQKKLKTETVALITGIEPYHLVPRNNLQTDVQPEPISTKKGYQQHLDQPLSWLIQIVLNITQRAFRHLKSLREDLEEREMNLFTREAQVKNREQKLEKQEQDLDKQLVDVQTVETDVADYAEASDKQQLATIIRDKSYRNMEWKKGGEVTLTGIMSRSVNSSVKSSQLAQQAKLAHKKMNYEQSSLQKTKKQQKQDDGPEF